MDTEKEDFFENHPFVIEVEGFKFEGLSSFFEENMINLGKEADYFLVIGDDLTDPA